MHLELRIEPVRLHMRAGGLVQPDIQEVASDVGPYERGIGHGWASCSVHLASQINRSQFRSGPADREVGSRPQILRCQLIVADKRLLDLDDLRIGWVEGASAGSEEDAVGPVPRYRGAVGRYFDGQIEVECAQQVWYALALDEKTGPERHVPGLSWSEPVQHCGDLPRDPTVGLLNDHGQVLQPSPFDGEQCRVRPPVPSLRFMCASLPQRHIDPYLGLLQFKVVDPRYSFGEERPPRGAQCKPFCIDRDSQRGILVSKALHVEQPGEREHAVVDLEPGSGEFCSKRNNDVTEAVWRLEIDEQA